MRVAHFSDLHVLALEGVSRTRFLNKRFTGLVNLKMKREHKHRPAHVKAVARAVGQAKVDHVVITGDLTNLALEQEFEAVVRLIEEDLGIPAENVTIVPGNHDLYTRGAMRAQRFTRFFAPYLESDLPSLAAEIELGRFPIVKLRGPLAIIGLSSAVPRPPLVASGELGERQIEALARILEHDEVKRRTPVIAWHHPIHNPPSRVKTLVEGLVDADDVASVLDGVGKGLLLHGHLHKRIQRAWPTRAGSLVSVGATSASLHHEDEHRMAGFNVYDFDGAGDLQDIQAHILNPETGEFRLDSVPKLVP
jgi:3',5'-cyclic AMP phosphodiesterase CpdA